MSSSTSHILQEVFGYPDFRGQQAAVIDRVTAGGDALVLMPTGGGKSLCYQIPAIARQRAGQGVTLVISPLIALMHDQVSALQEVGVDAAFLNSTLTLDETQRIEQRLLAGELTLLYAAPERVTSTHFLSLLERLHKQGQFSLIAVDEAHCVSQWGHDFRPEYRALNILWARWPDVPRMALTATADAITRADIIERLDLQQAEHFISSFDRPNINYTIVEKDKPTQQLLDFIESRHKGNAGIVYAPTRKRVEELAAALNQHGLQALPYHAGLSAELRQQHQDRFLREDGLIMVATIAFGMGIDKPDVRFVAHMGLPKNIEGYYQETGRAGRDGQPADAWMCYGLQDVVNQSRMINESDASDDFKRVMRGKLDALLGLAEAIDCRRVRLLAYFDETYRAAADASTTVSSDACMHCDNCLEPPQVWDGTDCARKLLSTIYRLREHSGFGFGMVHLMDVLRGKATDKVQQFGHERISTFGLGREFNERQLRGVLRQLIGIEAVQVDASAYNTLRLMPGARPILRGEQSMYLRASTTRMRKKTGPGKAYAETSALDALPPQVQKRFQILRAWRREQAKRNDVAAFVIFNNATLQAIAERAPQTLEDLSRISGVGAVKLQRYGEDVIALCAQA